MTRGLREIARLGVKLRANPLTFQGLAGMGDLVLTCTGDLSRNRSVGIELARGRPLAELVAGMNQVAEGIRTTRAACALADLHKVEMPICQGVRMVLDGEIPPADAVRYLMSRQLRNENE
jgi:glycerol-3-phosphate dehydrogenase (NAD(P)+)